MKQHEIEYTQLKFKLAEMSALTATMINNSITALLNKDSQLATSTIEKDEEVDKLDLEIDEHCLKILALYEPKAIDLRAVITASRVIVDLERVGDHCVDICKEIISLNKKPQIKPYLDLPKMGEVAAKMIEGAVDSYFKKNKEKALKIIKQDEIVNNFNNQIFRELLTYIAEDFSITKSVISLMMITKSLERIADYATNIGEMVYFMVTGKMIRHKLIKDLDSY